MKNYLIIGIALMMLAGCSDKYESLDELDKAPAVTLSRSVLQVRVGDTLTQAGLIKVITADAENNAMHLEVLDTSKGKVKVWYDKKEVSGVVPIINDTTKLYVIPFTAGNYKLQFDAVDRFGKKGTADLLITTIPNQPPVARLTVTQVTGREYMLDGSASSDPDGVVKKYHFLVDGNTISSSLGQIRHIFPGAGQKTIQLIAEDDAAGQSIPFTVSILVQ